MKISLNRTVGWVVLVLFAVLFTLPFVWQISTSLKTEDQVGKSEFDLVPKAQTMELDGSRVEVKPVSRSGANQVIEVMEGPKKGAKLTVDSNQLTLRPHLEWSNYSDGFKAFPFFHMLKNTLVICVLVVLGTVLSCSLAAYGLACVQWKGREILFWAMLATMMLPAQVTM